MEFIRGVIKWIIIAIIIILIIILIGRLASKHEAKQLQNTNNGLRTITNQAENDFDNGLETIDNALDNTREEDRVDLQTLEDTPDTASSSLLETIFGLIILGSGTYYIYKSKENN